MIAAIIKKEKQKKTFTRVEVILLLSYNVLNLFTI